jgi:AhpD family alkylhydroperoxidase
MTRDEIYQEMEQTLGLVPSMFKLVPDETLEQEWRLFKWLQLGEGAVPQKYRELIGLAVSAQGKCKYCTFFHETFARAAGATDEEIEDALHAAKSSVGWSTYITGHQLDFEQFKDEVQRIAEHVKEAQGVTSA